MSPYLRQYFRIAIITATLSAGTVVGLAQGLQPGTPTPGPFRHGSQPRYPMAPGAPGGPSATSMGAQSPASTSLTKPSPSVPATAAIAEPVVTRRSMLDDPAGHAQVQLSGDRLSINATNASLSEVIRQVAGQTGMQVEGNSRDERVFGVYGPGKPPEVLSALLYDSGYNVVMVGSTADGAPRKLLLSARTAASTIPQSGPVARNNDDDDEEPTPQEAPPPPNPGMMAPGAMPPSQTGQPKTPQQMLEELQRMHQGQQPPDIPHQQDQPQ